MPAPRSWRVKPNWARCCRREEGKTLPEGIGEVTRAGHIFKYFAGEALRAHGEVLDSVRPGVKVEITREPVGVVGLICPWNFPIAIPAWKMAPAIAFGNTVVCKPAELTPGCAWELADILNRAGLPKGVLNVVFARGSVAGPLMIDGCDAISFTGSVPTGTRVRDQAVAKGKRVQCEMGGKNPVVVLDDADLDNAVNSVLNSSFFSSGHRCTASSRIIVTEGIADKFVEALAAATKAIKVGDSRADGIQMGPIASQEQLDIARDAVAKAKAQGGTVVAGGEDLTFGTPGYYYAPTLIDKTTPDMAINIEEVFGPVASVIRVKDLEEAIKVANDTEMGLSAGICTKSLKAAETFKRRIQSGMGHGQSADRRCRLSRAVRWPQSLQLRPARTRRLCGGILHDRQDGLSVPALVVGTHQAFKRRFARSAAFSMPCAAGSRAVRGFR